MLSLLTNPVLLIEGWYSWGVAIAFAITFVTTLWIFFDSQSNDYQAALWRWLSLLSAIIVIPSVILSFSPALMTGLPATLIQILAMAGIIATLISLFSLLLYGLGLGVSAPEVEPAAIPNPVAPLDDESGLARAGARPDVHPTPTPPRGVLPATKEKPVTPQRITPTGSDTIRIKNAYENELPLAWVVALNGPHAGQEYRLQKITDIGRESDHNDVALNDSTISRQHARIRYEKGAFVIYDLASANGVFINGEQVQRRVITHRDRIKLGQVMLGVLMVNEDLDEDVAMPSAPAAATLRMEG
jgi:hypothetical protein